MVPGIGHIVKLNQQFILDIRSRGQKFALWMKDRENDNFCVKEIYCPEHNKFYRLSIKNLRTNEEYRISVSRDGRHPIKRLSEVQVFNFSYYVDDVCKKCEIVGTMVRTACICNQCGKIIWGC